MIYTVSKINSLVYRHVAKPLLFTQTPDSVHQRLVCVGAKVQQCGLLRSVLHASWSYSNLDMLSTEVCGLRFTNPIGLSAGFDKNFELVPLLQSIGFGFMEGGSITAQYCSGNPRPWFYRLPNTKSLVVYAGLANEGAVRIIDRIHSYKPTLLTDFPLNVSVAKTNSPEVVSVDTAIADYATTLRLLKKSQVGSMITLNISCPNTYGGEPFSEPMKLEALLSKVDTLGLKVPVFVKMPSDVDWDAFKELLDVIVRHRIAGVTICNLVKDRTSVQLHDDLPSSIKGNLSGKPVFDVSNELIRKTYSEYGDVLKIIGVGGVFTAQDAYTKITLGASLVELITGMIFEGPQVIGQINRDLVTLLRADGYTNVSQAIGSKNTK